MGSSDHVVVDSEGCLDRWEDIPDVEVDNVDDLDPLVANLDCVVVVDLAIDLEDDSATDLVDSLGFRSSLTFSHNFVQ